MSWRKKGTEELYRKWEMYSLSNDDFAMAVRLLRAFAATKGDTLREREDRRQATLLFRKMEKRQKTAK